MAFREWIYPLRGLGQKDSPFQNPDRRCNYLSHKVRKASRISADTSGNFLQQNKVQIDKANAGANRFRQVYDNAEEKVGCIARSSHRERNYKISGLLPKHYITVDTQRQNHSGTVL